MLEKIEYLLPQNEKNEQFFQLLGKLFKNINDAIIWENEIHLISSHLKPKTIFKLDKNISEIKLNIGDEKFSDLLNKIGKDNPNPYGVDRVSIQEVESKLAGHITRVDHTGIGVPVQLYRKEEWNGLVQYLSSITNMYYYPTGELWPFVIPVTKEENKNEITDFEILREPKFELVYTNESEKICLHFDMGTDLSKEEVEDLFPNNKGVYFTGLENLYKGIYLQYNGGIDIRLDIRFKSPHGDWESGKWLVHEGKRIKF